MDINKNKYTRKLKRELASNKIKYIYLGIFLSSPLCMIYAISRLPFYTNMASSEYAINGLMWIVIFTLTGVFGIKGFFKD